MVRDILTGRQLELLALYASGYDYEAIGLRVHLSKYTVRNTLKLGQTRAGARSLAHLAVIAFSEGTLAMNGDRVARVAPVN